MSGSSTKSPQQANLTSSRLRVALVGNPNTGKTTLFNRLTGLRARTANYPGITVDVRSGIWATDAGEMELFDLPGMYSFDALSPEEAAAKKALQGDAKPDVVVLVVDSTNIQRNLFLASQVRELQLPTIVALTLTDVAEKNNITPDVDALAQKLKCPVTPVSSRTGVGLKELAAEIKRLTQPSLSILQEEYKSPLEL